ncbi:MAG: hypothetical protein H6839_11975 [Planctomycetes bacterium]|nr:hypothetical protein [Planctomycetota bacterium]
MRYLLVLACFAVVLSATACTFDDGDETSDDSAIAVAGKDIILDIGVARLEISGVNVGAGTGQIPEGSKVKLEIEDYNISGRKVYSPVVRVRITQGGSAVTGINLNPAAQLEISYDFNAAIADGNGQGDITLLKIDGTTETEINYTALTPADDADYTVVYPGRLRANFTSFSRFAVTDGGSGGTTLPSVTALTGTTSTVLTATLFQLADTGAVFNVTVALPTALTTTPPTTVSMNDASLDASMPTDPNNRGITVQTGGVTYTTDAPAGSVSFQLDVFTGTGSSGSMVGTVVEQGGSATLLINFTFTTGTAGANALGGTVTDIAGRRTLNLQDGGGTEQFVVLMPDTFPNLALDPITFDDSTYDTGNPTDPAGRIVTVTSGGETFSSDVPTIGSVTITFTSFDSGTLVGAGTITGTVVSATPNLKTLNYTFTTTAGGGGGGGTSSFTSGTPVVINGTDVADECAVCLDLFSGDYMTVWLSDVGTTNRTLEMAQIDSGTLAMVGSQLPFEPTAALDPAGGLGVAGDDVQNLCIVGATGGSATTDTAVAVFYFFDQSSPALNVEVNLGTGTAPRVVYHEGEDTFVVAWQSGTDVMVQAFTFDGVAVDTAHTAVTGGTLKGLSCYSGSPSSIPDEALITADDGSGIVGQYLTVSTGVLNGTNFDLSTSLSGGISAWDEVGEQYLVIFQQLVSGFFTSQVVLALAPGTTVPLGTTLTLAAAAEPTQSCSGDVGALFADPGANIYPVDSSGAGPAMVATGLFGSFTGLNIDTTTNGGAVAGAGSGGYVLIAATGATGITAIPLTLTP